MRRLLAVEREQPGPALEVQLRIVRRMTASLAGVPRAGRGSAVGTVAVVALAAGLGLWTWRVRPSDTRPALVEPARAPVAPRPAVPVPSAPSLEAPVFEPTEVTARPKRVDTLAVEQRLVESARGALAHGESRAAVEALEAHAHRFPRGQLREERESLIIRALLTRGRPAAARERAESFLARDGESLFAPVVRELLTRARSAEGGLSPESP